MNESTENGIICSKEDEKELVKRINAFLTKECNYRKMYKWKDDVFRKNLIMTIITVSISELGLINQNGFLIYDLTKIWMEKEGLKTKM